MNLHSRLVRCFSGLAALTLAVLPSVAWAQDGQSEIEKNFNAIKWIKGPAEGDLGNAKIKIPAGYRFTGASGTEAYLHASGNNYGGEVGLLEPMPSDKPEEESFFIIFDFDDSGYVKDDEKDQLDDEYAETLLKQFKEGTEHGNAERKRRGASPIFVTGWNQKPFFDDQTKNLTWAVVVSGQGGSSVNYESKVLGRRGVMSVNMVLDEKKVKATVPEYRKLISGMKFNGGETYAEYRDGDKLATYGLIGLAGGGMAIAAVKWWKPLMKFGIFILAGVGLAVKKVLSMFRRSPA